MADIKKPEKPKHLRDLFVRGKQVTIKIPRPGTEDDWWEFDVWVQKPSVAEQEEAAAKARAAAARQRARLKDKDSDEYLSLLADIEDIARDELKERIVAHDAQRLRQQAFNDVMFNEDFQLKDDEGKPLYGAEGVGYADLLSAIADRMEEIDRRNDDLPEDERKDRWISYEDDEDLWVMNEKRDVVEQTVQERYDDLYKVEVRNQEGKPTAELQAELIRLYRDTELSVTWYSTYQTYMLWQAVREMGAKQKHYFANPNEVLDLPIEVREFLTREFESLSVPGVELKN